jgi:hypothetical protein
MDRKFGGLKEPKSQRGVDQSLDILWLQPKSCLRIYFLKPCHALRVIWICTNLGTYLAPGRFAWHPGFTPATHSPGCALPLGLPVM